MIEVMIRNDVFSWEEKNYRLLDNFGDYGVFIDIDDKKALPFKLTAKQIEELDKCTPIMNVLDPWKKKVNRQYDGEHQISGTASVENSMILGQLIFATLPPNEIEAHEVLDAILQNLMCMSKTFGIKSIDLYDESYGSCTITINQPKDYRHNK